jgi:hypothetical protein
MRLGCYNPRSTRTAIVEPGGSGIANRGSAAPPLTG